MAQELRVLYNECCQSSLGAESAHEAAYNADRQGQAPPIGASTPIRSDTVYGNVNYHVNERVRTLSSFETVKARVCNAQHGG